MALVARARPALPADRLAAHVLGYTDVDGNGSAGIERAFDDRLRDPAQRGDAAQAVDLEPDPAGARA